MLMSKASKTAVEERLSFSLRWSVMANIIAVGLLTQRDLDVLGNGFNRLWLVDETPCFAGLIQAIDEADRQLIRERDNIATTRDLPRPAAGRRRS